jgi:hypothetical protein
VARELALAGVDVAVVERRASQDLTGSRAGGHLALYEAVPKLANQTTRSGTGRHALARES